jgi:mannose-6-phosphate isomerase-like protein (cupin superfamily)
MNSINLEQKFGKFSEHFHPFIIGELNENYVKIVKAKGELVWHSHEHEDELFIILSGTMMMDFRDKTVAVNAGEILIVPRGVEHRPWTLDGEEVKLILVEPKETKHTGEVKVQQTVEKQEWI